MSGPKYSANAPTVDEMFGSLVGKALRRQNDDRLDVAIDICLDVEKLGGHALDCANALSAFKFHLAKATAPEGPTHRDWSATVVSASKTLATDKEQMEAYLDAQQELSGVPSPELKQLLKQLEKAKDLPEFLKAIS